MSKIGNALNRFRRMSPLRLLKDIRRARRLGRIDAAELALARPEPRPERLVVTLTTIPDRMTALGPVLASLVDQTITADRIILWRPDRSRRSGEPYPDPGPLPAGVEVLPCTDEGPATKLLPALVAEPDAAIVVVDDDVIYPADFLEQLLAAHRQSHKAAIGWRGWQIVEGRHPKRFPHVFATALAEARAVDILLGTWGYLVPPRTFDAAVHDFTGFPEESRFVDDVWFSGHMARLGVPRLVIPARGLPIETHASGLAALTDGPNSSGRNDLAAIEAFRRWW